MDLQCDMKICTSTKEESGSSKELNLNKWLLMATILIYYVLPTILIYYALEYLNCLSAYDLFMVL